jgi:hypothetical protein
MVLAIQARIRLIAHPVVAGPVGSIVSGKSRDQLGAPRPATLGEQRYERYQPSDRSGVHGQGESRSDEVLRHSKSFLTGSEVPVYQPEPAIVAGRHALIHIHAYILPNNPIHVRPIDCPKPGPAAPDSEFPARRTVVT